MKRKKRYADGGGVDEELVVEGMRPQNFNLASLNRGSSSGGMGPSMPGGGGGMPAPAMGSAPARAPMPIGRTAGYLGPTIRGEGGERVSMGMGRRGAIGAGASIPFKKGGKVKKMAKGGSTASKRADGCATKGKTKGRFV
jgi:hypothetical protein